MQIVIILRNILNTTLSYVQWAYYNFQLIFDTLNVNNDKQRQTNKTKNDKLFFCKLFRVLIFFFLILLKKVTLESKVVPTNRNSSAFLLHTSKTFSNVDLFSIFSQTLLELLFTQSTVLFT